MTANEDSRSLIRHPSGTPMRAANAPGGVLHRMTTGTLQVMRRAQLAVTEEKRFTIGCYEFVGPDYRQILMWAEALNLQPEELVQKLQDQAAEELLTETLSFEVVDGSIRSLVWDLAALPINDFTWVDGLRIERAAIITHGAVEWKTLTPRLPNLTVFGCRGLGLHVLDLSFAPGLRKLNCSKNKLTRLHLCISCSVGAVLRRKPAE